MGSYRSVINRLILNQITTLHPNGELGHMKTRITVRDVAAQVGVSHTTVSLALRGDPRIPPGTRKRVRLAANRLGYRRDAMLSTLMTHLRSMRVHPVHATLGFVAAWPTRDGWRASANLRRFHRCDAPHANSFVNCPDAFRRQQAQAFCDHHASRCYLESHAWLFADACDSATILRAERGDRNRLG